MARLPTAANLADAIHAACKRSLSQLFEARPHETFYYCALITTGEGHSPVLTAWSQGALIAAAREAGNADAARDLKWSYADSPYFGFGEAEFAGVRALFEARPKMDPENPAAFSGELSARLAAMEMAMAQLDREGVFGIGARRTGIVVNVEVVPPDRGNTERAMRLNPPDALVSWLHEAAET